MKNKLQEKPYSTTFGVDPTYFGNEIPKICDIFGFQNNQAKIKFLQIMLLWAAWQFGKNLQNKSPHRFYFEAGLLILNILDLERAVGIEPITSSLGSSRSAN